MKSMACVSMAYNEAIFLPAWYRYYSSQVGAEHCYIIDHGSTDGSTDDLGRASRITIPRSALDENKRCAFISNFCNALLSYYDFVLFTDSDEIVVVDPDVADNLISYLDMADEVTTCVGFNMMQDFSTESKLDLNRPILNQRSYVLPRRSMCKPSLFGRPIKFTPGFHSYDGPINFGGLFLFHLAYVDLDIAKARQAKRRSQIFINERMAAHHRSTDSTVNDWMEGWWKSRPIELDLTFRDDDPICNAYKDGIIASEKARVHATYGFDMDDNPAGRWKIPERFQNSF